MKIIVTSGNISEPIDQVRSIVNYSTGSLGKLITAKLVEKQAMVYYVYHGHEPLEHSKNIKNIHVDRVVQLEEILNNLLTSQKIHAVVHAMAVSDYHVSGMMINGMVTPIPNKISSDDQELILVLSKNKKIISIIKDISPDTKLVGFKLLFNVPKQELLEAAYTAMKKNKADIVVANDKKDITKEQHQAIIIDEKTQTQATTKEEIADILVEKLVK